MIEFMRIFVTIYVMKRMDKDLFGVIGSIPPQLLPLVDRNNMAAQAQEFVDFMNDIARDCNARVSVNDFLYKHDDLELVAPRKLYGPDVKYSFVGRGTMGAVFKMEIAGHTFALKINRASTRSDILGFYIHKRARNLINRPYIGSVFKNGRQIHSWMISDYVADDRANSFERAKEKLFYAILSKGISYEDLYTPGNVKDGRIVDFGGLQQYSPNLSRMQIDMVKKFLHMMRTDDVPGFQRLADAAMQKQPAVIKYLFVQMSIFRMEMPDKFAKFKKIIDACNAQIKAIEPKSR